MTKNYKIFDIMEDVNDRLLFLNEQRERLEELLVNLPDGKLLVAPGKSDDSFRYYLRSTPQDKMGVYLHKEDSELKSQLAFKKYATAAVKNISEEIDKLEKVQKLELKDSLIGTYEDLNQGVKQLINPIVVDDETYIKMWKSIPYEGLSFSPDDKTEYYSNLNERMRSKSEVSIANMLLELGIPYKYECPIIRKNGENFYPDFTILDIKRRRIIYLEHLGRMGDSSYIMKNIWKLDEYKKMGIYLGVNLFITFESDISPMGTKEPLKVIKAMLDLK